MAETGKDVNYEEWYNEQVNNIVQANFAMQDVRNKVLSGERNVYIEKLLVGLLSWN